MPTDRLRQLADRAALRALSEQDRDPYSPTRGCFDRRYWAWKLVDFPEATFQRNVYPLALLYRDPRSQLYGQEEVCQAVGLGVRFALQIQHRNGSFDQAFPFEQSWGATAFLLHPLLEAVRLVAPALDRDAERIRQRLAAAGRFLCREGEQHGRITNHLAGGALSLYAAAASMNDAVFRARADRIVRDILANQSAEGWFPEYGGADPGYQTLCLYYLAEIAHLNPTPELAGALDRSLEFLQWFVHPNGTLGGIYGSRRTRVAYLGGFARLARRSPLAASMLSTLTAAMVGGDTVSVDTIDSGNLAPLFTNLVCSMRDPLTAEPAELVLPAFGPPASRDFAEAGLCVRSASRYYAIVGVRNGATVTVFDRASGALALDDGGYVGELTDGSLVTSQVSELRAAAVDDHQVATTVTFCAMPQDRPTPGLFLVLRLLNLTLMRSIRAGNLVKRLLVRRLIGRRSPAELRLHRRVVFGDRVLVEDRIENPTGLRLRWLRGGRPFNSIHMASAGYFEAAALRAVPAPGVDIDVERLYRDRVLTTTRELP